MHTIKIAVTKGKLADQTLALLAAIGIKFEAEDLASRRLIVKDSSDQYSLIFVKGFDVATYVARGVADIGVVGKDCLLERPADVYEMIDLGYGACRLSVCGEAERPLVSHRPLTVASKYPQVAKRYFESRGQACEVIALNGSVELAPLVGLADVIVDIVETGKTLLENNLVERQKIVDISARLIVNKVSLKTKPTIVKTLLPQCERQVRMENN